MKKNSNGFPVQQKPPEIFFVVKLGISLHFRDINIIIIWELYNLQNVY
jgi:hypothetical protein